MPAHRSDVLQSRSKTPNSPVIAFPALVPPVSTEALSNDGPAPLQGGGVGSTTEHPGGAAPVGFASARNDGLVAQRFGTIPPFSGSRTRSFGHWQRMFYWISS